MSPFHPEEPKKLDIIGHLEELRERILFCLAALVVVSAIAFAYGTAIMVFVKKPLSGQVGELIFIGPTEAFVAYVKVALLTGFVLCFPLILYHVWAFVSPAAASGTKKRAGAWLSSALVLFFSGIAFSYFLAVPAALKFLISFGSEIASPKITLGKYISFFGALIMIGGVIFEIPIAIGFLADTGLLASDALKRKRYFAILAIMVFAAVITPTQDIVNMLLFALPMMLLYEIGILIAAFIEYRRRKDEVRGKKS